jgi:ribosomal protein S6
MEKGLSSNFDNFGVTHELSFAYSITPNLTEDRVMLEDDFEDALVNNEEEDPQDELTAAEKEAEIEDLKRRLTENDEILAELIFRQDSLEQNQQRDLEQRFEMVMRMVRRETQGKRPEIEEKAKELYFNPQADNAVAERQAQEEENRKKALLELKKQKDELVQTHKKEEVVPEVTQDRTKIVATTTSTATKKAEKTSGVKSRKFRDLEGVTDGYYVVANVYKGDYYLNKFVDKLNREGYDADYIDNPNNGMKYVYLKRYNTWKEAKAAYETKMGGTYDGDLWIMNVENRYTNEAYVENTRKLEEKSSRYAKDVLQQNVVVRDNVNEGQEPKTYELKGVGGGFYIIANVFANPKNANRFVKLLNSRGLSASYFINPENNYRYVYLKKHESWNNALISYYSNLNDAYNDKMWIMRVTPNLIT